MSFKNVLKSINESFKLSGYARTAQELNLLSNEQLEDLGISRELLKLGASGYPWRTENVKVIPDNVSQIKPATSSVDQTTVMSKTPKAA